MTLAFCLGLPEELVLARLIFFDEEEEDELRLEDDFLFLSFLSFFFFLSFLSFLSFFYFFFFLADFSDLSTIVEDDTGFDCWARSASDISSSLLLSIKAAILLQSLDFKN
jgi:hypothetical protein